jgi:hypothetical protein
MNKLNQTIDRLDGDTQQNAAFVEETSQVAASLRYQVDALPAALRVSESGVASRATATRCIGSIILEVCRVSATAISACFHGAIAVACAQVLRR